MEVTKTLFYIGDTIFFVNQSFLEKLKKEDPTFRFFMNLMQSKKPKITGEMKWVHIKWLAKYGLGMTFSYLHNKKATLETYLTKYFPFSLLLQDRWIHHSNQYAKKFILELEKVAVDSDISIFLYNGVLGNQYTEFSGSIETKGKKKSDVLKKLEIVLDKEFSSAIVRDITGGVKILVPTEDIPKI